jgi:hypothetical protein
MAKGKALGKAFKARDANVRIKEEGTARVSVDEAPKCGITSSALESMNSDIHMLRAQARP